MRIALQRLLIFDAVIARDSADQLTTFPVREDAVEVLTCNPSHGGQVELAKFLADHDAVRANALAEMLGEFDKCERDPPPQRQETFRGNDIVSLAQARRKQHQQVRVEVWMFLGTLMEFVVADEQELAVAQSNYRG